MDASEVKKFPYGYIANLMVHLSGWGFTGGINESEWPTVHKAYRDGADSRDNAIAVANFRIDQFNLVVRV